VISAVFATDSELLDLGRKARLVSPAQRADLALRDRGCAFPDCDTFDRPMTVVNSVDVRRRSGLEKKWRVLRCGLSASLQCPGARLLS
jgi:hypothetical protein